MLLDLAETLNPLLNRRAERLEAGFGDDGDVSETTLQLIFFDGEEAFKDWTDTDSVYGSRFPFLWTIRCQESDPLIRHLAHKWATAYISPNEKRRLMTSYAATEISTIEHLILLDLLGAPDPLIISYFIDTAWLFDAMASSERRLADSGAFRYGDDQESAAMKSFFRPRKFPEVNLAYIGDDHVPFLHHGVSVLHIIPVQFPRVWHTTKVSKASEISGMAFNSFYFEDDASALDIPTMRRWNLILRVFMTEYLNLQPEPTESNRSTSQDTSGGVQRSDSDLVSL
jgi:glutaminyl-peptide cyclotransferase